MVVIGFVVWCAVTAYVSLRFPHTLSVNRALVDLNKTYGDASERIELVDEVCDWLAENKIKYYCDHENIRFVSDRDAIHFMMRWG